MKNIIISLVFLYIFFQPNIAAAKTKVIAGPDVYSSTVERVRSAAKNSSIPYTLILSNLIRDKLHLNGSRDNLILLPNNLPEKSVNLIVWLHGCNGFSKRTFSKRILSQAKMLYENGSSFIFAVPELPWSANTSTKCKRLGRAFRRPGELNEYILNVKKTVDSMAGKADRSYRVVIIGHSGGGSAIRALSLSGDLCSSKAAAVVWSDASYGSWFSSFLGGCVKEGFEGEIHVVARKGDKPYRAALSALSKRSTKDMKLKLFPRFMKRRSWTHSRIGDRILSIVDVIPPGC
tara:strand:+ start:685 stop:1554 length:870 start_codon:yes stop_codon:yes gene_type:complete